MDDQDDFWDFYDDYMANEEEALSNYDLDADDEDDEEDEVVINGCYLATCAYGSYDCPEVWVLRRFRDSFLKSFPLGRWFIRVYYATSPLLVSFLGQNRVFKHSIKALLTPLIVFLKWKGYSQSPYND